MIIILQIETKNCICKLPEFYLISHSIIHEKIGVGTEAIL